jgi:Uncharacterized conserved protein (DUF2190)
MAVQRQDGWATDAKESASDLTGKEYCFATRTSAGKFDLCGSGGKIAGVISEGRIAGKHTSINTGGQLKAIAGGTIAVGDNVQSDGSGHAITGSSNPCGTAINSAVQGEYVEINIDRV